MAHNQPPPHQFGLNELMQMHQYFNAIQNPSPKVMEIKDKLEQQIHQFVTTMSFHIGVNK